METAKTPKIKRIQARSVVAAFKKTNTLPFRGGWHNRAQDQEGPLGCCGLGVMFLKVSNEDKLLKLNPGEFASTIQDALGLDSSYMWGFVAGFDGRTVSTYNMDSEKYMVGHHDGQKAWEAACTLRRSR